MGGSAQVKEEIRLRVEDLETRIRELEILANANGENFYIRHLDASFYCDEYIKDDEYLSEYHSEDGNGAWLSSSDFC